MSTSNFLFILSAIYIAPHVDKKTSAFWAIAFFVAALVTKFADA